MITIITTTRKTIILQGYERMNLCDALQSRRFKDGEKIICQGEQANGMYFIESGVSGKYFMEKHKDAMRCKIVCLQNSNNPS